MPQWVIQHHQKITNMRKRNKQSNLLELQLLCLCVPKKIDEKKDYLVEQTKSIFVSLFFYLQTKTVQG